MNPSTDSAWMQQQLDSWWSDFTLRTGLQHPDRSVEWHEPKNLFSDSGVEIIGLFRGEGVCDVWDCVTIGLDIASIGAQLVRDTSLLSIPVSGPVGTTGVTAGQVAQGTVAASSVGWTLHQAALGNASNADLAFSGVTTLTSFVPVAGEFATVGQLLWDLFDPFLPW